MEWDEDADAGDGRMGGERHLLVKASKRKEQNEENGFCPFFIFCTICP